MDFETQAASGSRLEKGSSVLSRFWCGIATGIDLFDEASYIYIISFICKFLYPGFELCSPIFSDVH